MDSLDPLLDDAIFSTPHVIARPSPQAQTLFLVLRARLNPFLPHMYLSPCGEILLSSASRGCSNCARSPTIVNVHGRSSLSARLLPDLCLASPPLPH